MSASIASAARLRVLRFVLLGTLLGFLQTEVCSDRDPRRDSIAAIVSPAHCNTGDVLPSVAAAGRIAAGRSPYGDVARDGSSFIYPPLAAALYRPLAGSPPEVVASRLFVAHRVLLALLFAILLALARPRSWREAAGVLAAGVLWYPLTRALALNQAGLVTTACVAGALLAMDRRRPAIAGALLAGAAAIKPPLALAIPLLWWHAPRAVASAIGTGAFLAAVSVLYAGWPAHVEYVTRVLPAVGPGYAFFPNQSWNGLFNRLARPELAGTFTLAPHSGTVALLTVALGLATLAFLAWRVRRLPRGGDMAVDATALAWLAATLASPVSWEHHYAPALFAGAWLWGQWRDGSRTVDPLPAAMLGGGAVLVGSYACVETLSSRGALLFASYGVVGAIAFALGWLRVHDGPAEARGAAKPIRWLVPLSPRAVRAIEAALLGAAVLAALFVLGNTLLFPYGRDQGIYAVIARTMNAGGAPYRDAWDFKPPGIFFVYALARLLFGNAMHGVRLVEALGFASIPVAFAIFSRRFVDSTRAGVIGGVLAIVALAQLEFWETAQPETQGAIALAWVLAVVAILSTGRASTGWWLVLGALYGVAGLMKPTLGAGVLLTPGLALWLERDAADDRSIATWWRAARVPYGLAALGAAAPVVLCVAWLAFKGALGPMADALFSFAPRYTRLGLAESSLAALAWRALSDSVVRFARHIAFGLVCLVAFGALARRERAGVLHVLAALLFPLLGIALQAKFFPYHFASVLALLSLLAGWGAWKLWVRGRGYAVTAAALVLLALLVPDPRPRGWSFWSRNPVRLRSLGLPAAEREQLLRSLHAAYDAGAGDSRAASDWIAAHTAKDAPIFVWGFEPVIYTWSDRPNASRYVHDVPQRAPWSAASRALLLDDLRRTRPAVVVLEYNDQVPTVTGNDLDSVGALRGFPELVHFLEPYAVGPRIGNLQLMLDPARVR